MALYAASLFNDGICIDSRCDSWPGWSILLLGGLALFGSPANATWLANPALFASWGLLIGSQWRAALIAAIVALAGGASFLLFDGVVSSESGGLSSITGTAIGYWLWLSSMAVACFGAALSLRQSGAGAR